MITRTIDSIARLRDFDEIGGEIKAVVFDYGGTLDSRGDHWSHVILDAYRSIGIDLDVEEFKEAYIFAERALEKNPIILPSDTFREVMRKKIELQHSKLGLDFDCKAVADRCYDFARECVAEARPTLEFLSRRVPLLLVSNFYGNLPAVTADFGIDLYFTEIVESSRVGIRKPDPAIFSLALKLLGDNGRNAGEVLVVGDSMKNDILPAQSLGCSTAHLPGRPWPPR